MIPETLTLDFQPSFLGVLGPYPCKREHAPLIIAFWLLLNHFKIQSLLDLSLQPFEIFSRAHTTAAYPLDCARCVASGEGSASVGGRSGDRVGRSPDRPPFDFVGHFCVVTCVVGCELPL